MDISRTTATGRGPRKVAQSQCTKTNRGNKDKVVSAVKASVWGIGIFAGTRAGVRVGRVQEAQTLFELILNTLLLDGPITTQTLIRNAGTSAYARHDEFAGKDQSSTCSSPWSLSRMQGMTHLPVKLTIIGEISIWGFPCQPT